MTTYHYQTPLQVEVKLEASSPTTSGLIEYKGEPGAVALTRWQLARASGPYGHTIDPGGAAPIDLDGALRQVYGDDLVQVSPDAPISYDIGPDPIEAESQPNRTDAEPILPSGQSLTPDEVSRIVRDLDTQEQIDAFLASVTLAEDDEGILPAILTAAPTEADAEGFLVATATTGLLLLAVALAGSYALLRFTVPTDWQQLPNYERRERAATAIANADRRIIDGDTLAQYRNAIDGHYRAVAQGHGQALAEGAIDLGEYHRRMVSTVTEAHTVQRRLGQGNLSPQGTDALQRTLDEQLGYLDDMVGAIERGELSAAQIRDRSGRYGGNGGLSFNEGMAAAIAVNAATEQRFLGACSPHCQPCVEYAARGRVPVGSLPVPKSACRCSLNCCCRLEMYDLLGDRVGWIG